MSEIRPLDDDEIIRILEDLIERSDLGAELSANRKAALDYYYCRPRGDEVAGRSQVQSGDVADMVEAILAQMLPSFTGDRICEFEPDGPNDEPQARLETDATNRMLMESSRGYVELHAALKDALLLKGGIIKGWVEEERQGRKKVRRLRLKAIDPTCFGVGPDQDSPILSETAFCWELKAYSRGELREMGFSEDQINQIPNRDTGAGNQQDRNIRSMQASQGPDVRAGWATEMVDVYEVHAELDCQGTGEAELYRFLMGGKVLLLKEPVDFVPYAAGAAWLEAHQFWGLSVYDKVKHVQDVKTAVMRQGVDNLLNCNFPRTLVNDRVNLDDYVTPRSGGAIRIDGAGPVMDAAMPVPPIDTSAGSMGFLQYMNQVRAERAGASLDLQQSTNQIMKSQAGADNIGTILGNAEMVAAMVARNLAETLVRSAFMLVHRLLRTDFAQPMTLRYADQWVTVDPRQWKPRDRVNIKAGLSPSERRNKAGNLQQIMQGILGLAQMGMDGVLVSPENLYNAFLDWAAASEVDAPEKYITNPSGQKSMQAAQAKSQQAGQQQQMMVQLEQQKAQLEGMKLQVDKANKDAELAYKYWSDRLSAEVEEAKLIGTATADLNRIELEGRFAAAQSERDRAGDGSGNGTGRGAA